MDNIIKNNWQPFNNGKSIGETGTENGVIIYDIENINGARVTLENKTDIAPFATTLGIYGVMFHTRYDKDESSAKTFIDQTIEKINKIFILLDTPEVEQDTNWKEKYNNLIEDLAEQ